MRTRLIWLWRLVLGGFAIFYLSSGTLQVWLPPLLPFLAAAAVEAQFFVSGLLSKQPRVASRDRGPQPRDLAEFGWMGRTVEVARGDAVLIVRPGDRGEEEIADWLRLHGEELDALGPGRHELAPMAAPESPVARYSTTPPEPRSIRPPRRLLQLALVLVLLSGAFLLDRSRASWSKLPADQRAETLAVLDRQAARIAGHPAAVICDVSGRHVGDAQDADGLAEVGGGRMWLTPGICYRLATIRHMTGRTETASGHAIAVLAHEAWHLHGETNEGVANCYAYQAGVGIGRALGLSVEAARRLMRQQLVDNPGDFADTPAYVVPAGCHRGGSLDLGRDGTHFP